MALFRIASVNKPRRCVALWLMLSCPPNLFVAGPLEAQQSSTDKLLPNKQTDAASAGEQSSALAEAMATVQAMEMVTQAAIARGERSVVAISRVPKDQVARAQLDRLRSPPALEITGDPTTLEFMPSFFGSGVIIGQDGYIVTCAHVLDDPRRFRYYVWLDHRCYTAEVSGIAATTMASDPFSDLAVLKIDAEHQPAIPISSQPATKGQFVIALGNPYGLARDGQASASWGIVSNTQRFAPKFAEDRSAESIHQLGTLIQTDLRLAVGSSGGALINLKGELIGLTTNLIAAPGYEQSAGLAIATDVFFQQVVDALKQGKQPEYGFLGIQPENLRQVDQQRGLSGARVGMVIPGLPGSQAGLREGDIITQVGEKTIRNRNDLFRELSQVGTGKQAKLVVRRTRGAGPPEQLQIDAELTKKYLATNRPAYSLHGPPTWRGAQVEYQSAIAGELERIAVVRGSPRVAFLNVTPDSVAWQAGLRAGYGIISLNGRAIESPDQFHRLTGESSGPVELIVLTTGGKQLQLHIP